MEANSVRDRQDVNTAGDGIDPYIQFRFVAFLFFLYVRASFPYSVKKRDWKVSFLYHHNEHHETNYLSSTSYTYRQDYQLQRFRPKSSPTSSSLYR